MIVVQKYDFKKDNDMNNEKTNKGIDLAKEVEALKKSVDELKNENLILKSQIKGISQGLKALRIEFNSSQK